MDFLIEDVLRRTCLILFRQSVLKGLEEVQKTAKVDGGLPDSHTSWSTNIK